MKGGGGMGRGKGRGAIDTRADDGEKFEGDKQNGGGFFNING